MGGIFDEYEGPRQINEDVLLPIFERYVDGVHAADIHCSIIDEDVRSLHVQRCCFGEIE